MLEPTAKGKKLYFPGRGVLTARAGRLPTLKRAFAAVAAQFDDRALELDGPAELVAAAEAARDTLRTGAPPTEADPRVEGVRWWLLSPSWDEARGGNPKALTACQRGVDKLIAFWLTLGGPRLAVQALIAAWGHHIEWSGAVSRRAPPAAYDIYRAFHYCERPLPDEAAVRALRARLAVVDDAAYADAVAAVRSAWPDLPAHLRAALAFVVPTEHDLARQLVDEMEGDGGREWPRWAPLVAWSLRDGADLARFDARRAACAAGGASIGFAVLTHAPKQLDAGLRSRMVMFKYAKA